MKTLGLAAIALASALSAAALAQVPGDPRKGEMFAQMVCAECHTVDSTNRPSPNPRAPSFASIVATPGMTALALRVWLQSPHPTMPNLRLEDSSKDNVIAYLLSLRGAPP